MRRHLSSFLGVLIFSYAVFWALMIPYGLVRSIVSILTVPNAFILVKMQWYIYFGSLISNILLGISSFRCMKASIKQHSGSYLIQAAMYGIEAYLLTVIEVYIDSQILYCPLYIIIPIIILIIGVLCDRGIIYVPFWQTIHKAYMRFQKWRMR